MTDIKINHKLFLDHPLVSQREGFIFYYQSDFPYSRDHYLMSGNLDFYVLAASQELLSFQVFIVSASGVLATLLPSFKGDNSKLLFFFSFNLLTSLVIGPEKITKKQGLFERCTRNGDSNLFNASI